MKITKIKEILIRKSLLICIKMLKPFKIQTTGGESACNAYK